ncbi:MAG: hypothetical protein U9R05_00870 [Chloroflexota bacterium]|nr:hypothetical protein [Chloroflexota bacterium]
MKKADISKCQTVASDDDMLPEYHFDYRQAHPNRFAGDVAAGSLVVVLEPDIAQVFKTSENTRVVLRAIARVLSQQTPERVSS